MIKIALNFLFLLLCTSAVQAQNPADLSNIDSSRISAAPDEIYEWLGDMFTRGVDMEEDSLVIHEEVYEILQNNDLRAALYPRVYSWDGAVYFLEKMELKRAFWYFINLYHDNNNRDMVLYSILKYEEIFPVDKALLSSYYTYSMLDPAVATFKPEGGMEIKRPDVLEAKFHSMREMVTYVLQYREQKQREEGEN